MHTYSRYVAIGDSQTEGIGDGDEVRGYRGFADRLAGRLAELNPDLRYANLAVRGKLAGAIRAEQLEPALALNPDLVTILAGVNDLIRPRCDVNAVVGHLTAMFAALTDAGAEVVTVTYPDIGKIAPSARPLRPRVLAYNGGVRTGADRYGVRVVDAFPHAVTTDPRVLSTDRLHASPLGHELIAASIAHALDLPGSDDTWTHPLPALPRPSRLRALGIEMRWVTGFVGPWIGRRIRGKSSGDGRVAKRPELLPIALPDGDARG